MVARKKKTQDERDQEAQRRKEFKGEKKKFFTSSGELSKEDFDAFKAEVKGQGRTTGQGSPELQAALENQGIVTTQKTKELGDTLAEDLKTSDLSIEQAIPLPQQQSDQQQVPEQPTQKPFVGGVSGATGPAAEAAAGLATVGGALVGGPAAIGAIASRLATVEATSTVIGTTIESSGVSISKFSQAIKNPIAAVGLWEAGSRLLNFESTVSDAQQAINTNRGVLTDISQKLTNGELDIDSALLRAQQLTKQNRGFIEDARKAASMTIGGSVFGKTRDLEADIQEYELELQDLVRILKIAQREKLITDFRFATQDRKTLSEQIIQKQGF